MAKIPYLIRRKNIYYFRLGVPVALREITKCREIIKSLETEDANEAIRRALKMAAHYKTYLHDLKVGKVSEPMRVNLPTPVSSSVEPEPPLLSVVVEDFLKRYDRNNKTMFAKLVSFMPIFVELIGNKPIGKILQADLNRFFDDVQKLPVRRDSEKFKGMSIRKMIAFNDGPCISQKTFYGTYRCCIGIFIQWAFVNYADQRFPLLSVQGANYRGERGNGINKQRAAGQVELQKLFNNPKMEKYAADPETVHYFWLPLIGLYTGARINEICQLNPGEDIRQDQATGIWYFHFTDESGTAEGVDKSIKTNSSRRIVPIHSQLIDLGFLNYVEKISDLGHKIIFPEWQPRNGKASANASKWFTRYLNNIGLRSEEQGARLSGFHMFRHGFVTFGITHKIQGVFQLTGHEVGEVEGFGKISEVAKGYWTRGLTDNIQELKEAIEIFDFGLSFCKPTK